MLPTLTPEPLYQVKYKPGIPRNRTKGNALRAYTIPENPCSYCYINPETVTGAECTLASQLVPVFEPLEVVIPPWGQCSACVKVHILVLCQLCLFAAELN